MIPDGWTYKPLGEISSITTGGTPSKAEPTFWENGTIPWVRTTEVQNCRLNLRDIPNKITLKGLGNSSTKIVPAGTILMALIGQGKTRGQVALLQIDAAINQNCAAITLSQNHNSIYFFNFLLSNYQKIRNISNSAGQSNLNGTTVKSIKALVPPYEEQRLIAKILSTWDQAIEATEKLIANSEAQKKALMQQLLTGKKRLPGFDGEWKQKSLASLAMIKKGTQKSKATLQDEGSYPVINGGISPSGYTDESNTAAGTITISEGGNSCGYVSLVETDFWSGGHCYTLNDLKGDRDFLFSVLKWLEPKIMRLRVGSGLPNIQKGAISQLEIPLPEQAEQVAIADVMNDQHALEAALQSDLERLNLEKSALMQQLLTGKRRVAINKEEAA